jgi:peptidoglycan hydrolase CwlO-like protein
MYSETKELNETITALITAIKDLQSEIEDLKKVNKETNSKLYTLNEHISTL